ncbi:hypothetical protein PVA45_07780 (plasmid) [Entomospira entomophila]|uniref:Uncharacterized protein n=1 Tax=Entomospira entomophila TaxID=2719988 RepID=A0A968GA44_9SPIO|nr:hypothetical protein [Entomospira entomophilus]NIZ41403.1 hypothetical protein [Entomospira entomophilus]WDI36353.1 hypothetical protein PVA45_07780 [Entomospira entomophilus]
MYQLFLLYTHADPPMIAQYLQLQLGSMSYYLFLHAGRFVALEDCFCTIPHQVGRYAMQSDDYLIEVDDHGVYLGISSSLMNGI